MKALIIGSNGQLGKQMQSKLKESGIKYNAFDIPNIDITDVASIESIFSRTAYDSVINCAAYTNVDGAESDYDIAYNINAIGPKNIATFCAQYDIDLFHISTDYVFSGDGNKQDGNLRPYLESDECNPKTVYGKTKLAGEEFVRQYHKKSYILRTAWLYGEGKNFVKTMLNLANIHDEIKVVDDQFGSPTSTVDLANAIVSLMGSQQYDTYHATCEGVCTWYEFASKIFELKKMNTKVIPVTSVEFPRPAKRPAWSVLENAKLKEQGKNVFRRWEDSLEEYLLNLDN